LREIADWIEHYRRFWEESFDRLDEYLHALQAQPLKKEKQRESKPTKKRRRRV
jgi:hypothetical protein